MADSTATPPPASSSWVAPLLSWRGMQAWSVGCRVPSLCRMFVVIKTRRLGAVGKEGGGRERIRKKKRRRGCPASGPPTPSSSLSTTTEEGGQEEEEEEEAAQETARQQQPQQLPRHSTGGTRRSEMMMMVMMGSPASSSPAGVRRNSDANARLSTSSYERLSVEYGNGGLELPRVVKLGACSPLHRQASAASSSFPRVSSASAGRSSVSSSSSSSGRLHSIIRDGVRLATQQPHATDLFAGNQFLTRLTAAPVPPAASARENSRISPSAGFVDAGLICSSNREADLKDRIIFFL